MTEAQLCTFKVDSMMFGVDVQCVQEVQRHMKITEVPLAPEAVAGLINLRGKIVTAIEIRSQLNLPPRDEREPAMNVVLKTTGSVVSLLVDSIGDVVELDETRLEPPPETMDNKTRRFVKALCKLDDGLLLVLDTDAVTLHLGG
jgi:purine-binding chemotaxis protein CheW